MDFNAMRKSDKLLREAADVLNVPIDTLPLAVAKMRREADDMEQK